MFLANEKALSAISVGRVSFFLAIDNAGRSWRRHPKIF
jgi:hypothetical protein